MSHGKRSGSVGARRTPQAGVNALCVVYALAALGASGLFVYLGYALLRPKTFRAGGLVQDLIFVAIAVAFFAGSAALLLALRALGVDPDERMGWTRHGLARASASPRRPSAFPTTPQSRRRHRTAAVDTGLAALDTRSRTGAARGVGMASAPLWAPTGWNTALRARGLPGRAARPF